MHDCDKLDLGFTNIRENFREPLVKVTEHDCDSRECTPMHSLMCKAITFINERKIIMLPLCCVLDEDEYRRALLDES